MRYAEAYTSTGSVPYARTFHLDLRMPCPSGQVCRQQARNSFLSWKSKHRGAETDKPQSSLFSPSSVSIVRSPSLFVKLKQDILRMRTHSTVDVKRTHVHAYVHMNIYLYTQVYIYTCIRMYMRISEGVCMHVITRAYASAPARMSLSVSIGIRVDACAVVKALSFRSVRTTGRSFGRAEKEVRRPLPLCLLFERPVALTLLTLYRAGPICFLPFTAPLSLFLSEKNCSLSFSRSPAHRGNTSPGTEQSFLFTRIDLSLHSELPKASPPVQPPPS